jgi:hypothetical protein
MGVQLHEACCQMPQDMLTYNQLNAAILSVGQHLCRQIKLVEVRWMDRVFGSNKVQVADAHLHLRRSTRGSLCVGPAIQDWLSDELQNEYAVAKERRKAREERALARPKGKAAPPT